MASLGLNELINKVYLILSYLDISSEGWTHLLQSVFHPSQQGIHERQVIDSVLVQQKVQPWNTIYIQGLVQNCQISIMDILDWLVSAKSILSEILTHQTLSNLFMEIKKYICIFCHLVLLISGSGSIRSDIRKLNVMTGFSSLLYCAHNQVNGSLRQWGKHAPDKGAGDRAGLDHTTWQLAVQYTTVRPGELP